MFCKTLSLLIAAFVMVPQIGRGDQGDGELMPLMISALISGNISELSAKPTDDRATRLAKEFTQLAANRLKSVNASLDSKCAKLLADFIYQGVEKLAHEPDADESQARDNLLKFINAEIEIGRKQNPQNPPIWEPTFNQAKGLLCPLWPFC